MTEGKFGGGRIAGRTFMQFVEFKRKIVTGENVILMGPDYVVLSKQYFKSNLYLQKEITRLTNESNRLKEQLLKGDES